MAIELKVLIRISSIFAPLPPSPWFIGVYHYRCHDESQSQNYWLSMLSDTNVNRVIFMLKLWRINGYGWGDHRCRPATRLYYKCGMYRFVIFNTNNNVMYMYKENNLNNIKKLWLSQDYDLRYILNRFVV